MRTLGKFKTTVESRLKPHRLEMQANVYFVNDESKVGKKLQQLYQFVLSWSMCNWLPLPCTHWVDNAGLMQVMPCTKQLWYIVNLPSCCDEKVRANLILREACSSCVETILQQQCKRTNEISLFRHLNGKILEHTCWICRRQLNARLVSQHTERAHSTKR